MQYLPIVIEDILVAGGGINSSCSWNTADKMLEEDISSKGVFIPFDANLDASKYFVKLLSKSNGDQECFRLQYDANNALFIDPRNSSLNFQGDACFVYQQSSKDSKKFHLKIQPVTGGVIIYNLLPNTTFKLEVKRSKYICTLSDKWNPVITATPVPNPTSGFVYLKLNSPLELLANIRIIDDYGHLIYDGKNTPINVGQNSILIDLNIAQPGILTAQIQFIQKNGPPMYHFCLIEKI
ncbi:MAG: hypothetical protein ACOYOA_08045 [Saprospiraceae bacterium]